MRPDVLHSVDVAHDGLGQIGKITLAEVSERKLSQLFRQPDSHVLDFTVNKTVSSVIL